MAIVRFKKVDVWAFIDADSDEAHTFRTYLGYWNALDALIVDLYGTDPLARIHAALATDRSFGRLVNRPFGGDAGALTRLLVNSWQHELALHLVDLGEPDLLRVSNHGSPVHGYYAVAQLAAAWSLIQTSTEPNSHRALLRSISTSVTNSPGLYPAPWGLRCVETVATKRYEGFASPPQPCSNLATNAPPLDQVAKCLHTTRGRSVDRLVEEAKRRERRRRARRGEKRTVDGSLEATTVFDFLLRARTRSSYGDPSMYYMGQLGDDDVVRFAQSVRRVTDSTCFLLLALVAQKAPGAVLDAATHFISRDRSQITDETLVPRLAELGMALPRRRRAS